MLLILAQRGPGLDGGHVAPTADTEHTGEESDAGEEEQLGT